MQYAFIRFVIFVKILKKTDFFSHITRFSDGEWCDLNSKFSSINIGDNQTFGIRTHFVITNNTTNQKKTIFSTWKPLWVTIFIEEFAQLIWVFRIKIFYLFNNIDRPSKKVECTSQIKLIIFIRNSNFFFFKLIKNS